MQGPSLVSLVYLALGLATPVLALIFHVWGGRGRARLAIAKRDTYVREISRIGRLLLESSWEVSEATVELFWRTLGDASRAWAFSGSAYKALASGVAAEVADSLLFLASAVREQAAENYRLHSFDRVEIAKSANAIASLVAGGPAHSPLLADALGPASTLVARSLQEESPPYWRIAALKAGYSLFLPTGPKQRAIPSRDEYRTAILRDWLSAEASLREGDKVRFATFIREWAEISLLHRDLDIFLAVSTLDRARRLVLAYPALRPRIAYPEIIQYLDRFEDVVRAIAEEHDPAPAMHRLMRIARDLPSAHAARASAE